MANFIGVSNEDCIITSDNPSALLYDDNHEELVEVIFPLSSKLVFMKSLAQTKSGFKNRLIELSKENIEYINHITMRLCKRWIYSKQPLAQEQIDWIIKDRS